MGFKWKEIIIKFALKRDIPSTTTTERRKEKYLYKTNECEDLFSRLNEYVLESVFMYLRLNDLISLSFTSKTMFENVKSFALHYILSHSRIDILNQCLNMREKMNLLIWEEKMFMTRLRSNNGTPSIDMSISALKYINFMGHFVIRCPITTASVVNKRSQYRKQRFIGMETYSPLGRDVLRLKQPCGISFMKRFHRVSSGRYVISVHVLLRPDLDCFAKAIQLKNNYVTQLTVKGEHVDEKGIKLKILPKEPFVLAQINLQPRLWQQISRGNFANELLEGNAWVIREPNSNCPLQSPNWFFIKLKPFEVIKYSNLTLEWRDIAKYQLKDCGRWNEGMCWDFVQLERL